MHRFHAGVPRLRAQDESRSASCCPDRGAEGIEGKEGVILNDGQVTVNAVDDAINANAAIEFNGAQVVAISTSNDAVDANLAGAFFMPFGGGNQNQQQDPAIIITAGTVFAWSQVGAPEEGLDCDFSPIAISGGRVFSVGAGMGEMPSVPTTYTAKQPTALLIGIDIAENQPSNSTTTRENSSIPSPCPSPSGAVPASSAILYSRWAKPTP